MQHRTRTTLAMLTLLAVNLPLQAAVLMEDSFNRSGALLGSTPDVGSGSWGSGSYTADGAVVSPTGGGWTNVAVFPLADLSLPSSGILSLKADFINVTDSGDPTNWAALSFFSGNSTDIFGLSHHWMALRANGATFAFNGAGVNNQVFDNPSLGASSSSASLEVQIDLDTNSVSYWVDGVNQGTTPLAVPVASLTGVGFGVYHGGVSYAVDNFSLAAVPEPSAYAVLAGAAALGLVAYRRRR